MPPTPPGRRRAPGRSRGGRTAASDHGGTPSRHVPVEAPQQRPDERPVVDAGSHDTASGPKRPPAAPRPPGVRRLASAADRTRRCSQWAHPRADADLTMVAEAGQAIGLHRSSPGPRSSRPGRERHMRRKVADTAIRYQAEPARARNTAHESSDPDHFQNERGRCLTS